MWMERPAGPTPPDAPPRAEAGVLDPRLAEPLVRAALEEDLGSADGDGATLCARDLTVSALVEPGARARGVLLAKAEGVLAGLGLFRAILERFDPGLAFEAELEDGARLVPGTVAARCVGSARALMVAERTALNFLQRLSGTASLTRAFVDAAGGRVRVLDTRKTTPGWRALERYAVRVGGGENHRYALDDEVMIKDNHADFAPGSERDPARRLAELVARARERYGTRVRCTAEARDVETARAALEAGADVLLLDNFELERLRAACADLRAQAGASGRRVELEASGGITLDTIAEVAACGVDRVSVGALTHSASALDLSLDLAPPDPDRAAR